MVAKLLSAMDVRFSTLKDSLVHTVIGFAERRSGCHEDAKNYGVISG